jgi:hypothetical protein
MLFCLHHLDLAPDGDIRCHSVRGPSNGSNQAHMHTVQGISGLMATTSGASLKLASRMCYSWVRRTMEPMKQSPLHQSGFGAWISMANCTCILYLGQRYLRSTRQPIRLSSLPCMDLDCATGVPTSDEFLWATILGDVFPGLVGPGCLSEELFIMWYDLW